MRKSRIIESIKQALREKRLSEKFGSEEFRRGCIGFAPHTYSNFLPKHRVGNPGGYTEYFKQHLDGSYSLLPKFR